MEWTDAAQLEMKRILERLRASLRGSEADPEEVAADIQARLEEELRASQARVITAEQVRAAALKLGIGDLTASEPPPVGEATSPARDPKPPARWRTRTATGLFWFAGIILPLLALGTELVTRLCFESNLADPLPTPFHAFLIALVPLASFLGWRAGRRDAPPSTRGLGLLLGAATAVAVYYTLLFITLVPFAILGLAAIFYFGLGLICLLPLSPLFSLIALLRLRVRLLRKLPPHAPRRLPLYRLGMLAGLAAIALASTPQYLTKIGLAMAASESPHRQLQGVRLLRTVGDEALMNRACYASVQMPADPFSWLIFRNARLSAERARDLYYRVTGKAFHSMAAPTLGFRSRRNPGEEFDWDEETGGDVVAGRLKGLSLATSRLDGVVHAASSTAYVEWIMVLRNDWHSPREARAQMALPPGGVVSRVTLWVDGEEREAAFGGRSQVKQAYKKVVQQRRDPLLVTTCGPDRVLVQCFPVPAHGEMKIRIGITAPLGTPSETGRTLRLPCLLERNFRIPEEVLHAVWIESPDRLASQLTALRPAADRGLMGELTDAELNEPAARLDTQSQAPACWARDGETAVLQEIRPVRDDKPDRLALVIDSSLGMDEAIRAVVSALSALPEGLPLSVLIADDEPVVVCAQRPANDALRKELQAKLERLQAKGGKPNGAALREALTMPSQGKPAWVVWIHGPQAWRLDGADPVRQALERWPGARLLDFQADHGPHRLLEELDSLAGFQAVPRTSTVEEDLKNLFRSLAADTPVWKPFRTAVAPADAAGPEADDHLPRLYALDRLRAALEGGRPDTQTALALALKYHLVTPLSGAVVLETRQQYDEAGLQPVESGAVPSVPEPGSLLLMAGAALLLIFGHRLARRLRTAQEA